MRQNLGQFFRDLRSQCSRHPLERCRWIRLPNSRNSISDHPKDQLARAGEDEAVLFLHDKGQVILHRNIRFPEGELDIVAREGETLVFVEVKTRRPSPYGSPSLAVQVGKQRRMIAAARRLMKLCQLEKFSVRFDVVAIEWPENATPTIEHFPAAFLPRDL